MTHSGQSNEDMRIFYDGSDFDLAPLPIGNWLATAGNVGVEDVLGSDWTLPYDGMYLAGMVNAPCGDPSGQNSICRWDAYLSSNVPAPPSIPGSPCDNPPTGGSCRPTVHDLHRSFTVAPRPVPPFFGWNNTDTIRLHPDVGITVTGSASFTGPTIVAANTALGWNGLRFEQGSSGSFSGGSLSGIVFPDDQVCTGPLAGVDVYDATVTFSGTVISGNDVDACGGTVLRAHGDNALVTLTNGTFVQDNWGLGAWADFGGEVRVEGNSRVLANTTGGLLATGAGSDLHVGHATVQENEGVGVAAEDNADAAFADGTTGSATTVSGNRGGLSAIVGGALDAGTCKAGGSCNHASNSITFNAVQTGDFDAQALFGGVLHAEGNRWSATSYGALVLPSDAASVLSVCPAYGPNGETLCTGGGVLGLGTRLGGGAASVEAEGLGGAMLSGTAAEVDAAHRALDDGDAQRALAHLVAAFEQAASADGRRLSFEAGVRLVASGALVLPPVAEAWVAARAAEPSLLRPWALRAMAAVHYGRGDLAGAVVAAQTLAAAFPDGEHGRYGLTLRVRLAVVGADEAGALSALSALAQAYPGASETARSAALVAAAFPAADVDGALGGVGRTAPDSPSALAVVGGAGPSALVVGVVPNPVADRAALNVEVASDAAVRIVVHDASGRAVAVALDGALAAGSHRLALNASALAPGVYVAHVVAHPIAGGAATVAVRRFVVVR